MQKHAIALGYFFLAVFCIFTSAQSFYELRIPLLLAALAAALAGFGILFSPFAARLQACKTWLVHMFNLARQPPVHDPKYGDERNR
jgi:hypothetical protein